MRIPKQITVAGHSITVRFVKNLTDGDGEYWGCYDDEKGEIVLKSGMEESRLAEIFLHECIHAIECIHNLNLNEKAVKILGIEILALLKNNKVNLIKK
jgi:hypothetical protein